MRRFRIRAAFSKRQIDRTGNQNLTQESKKRIIRSGIETVKMDQRQVHRHLSKKDKNKSSRKLTGRNRQSQKRENIVLKKTLPNSFLLQNRIIEKKYLWIYRL